MGNNNSETESILLVDDNPTNLQVLLKLKKVFKVESPAD